MADTGFRTDNDRWDLASSVGATATMVAAARAVASRGSAPLINDPFAAPLVRAVGIDFFTQVVDGAIPFDDQDISDEIRVMADVMAVRTRFFDDFFIDAGRAGPEPVRQAVILASGLDSRPYRLSWPRGTVVYEVDQPKVLEFKAAAMSAIGVTPSVLHRTVAADLREDWTAALRAAGFDDTAPTAWIAEGLLNYLSPEAQDQLFDDVTALSALGSRLATEYHPDIGAGIGKRTHALRTLWARHGFAVDDIPDVANLVYPGARTNPADYLARLGWRVSTHTRAEVFLRYGRTVIAADALATLQHSPAITAVLDRTGDNS